jgi:hypothetical protein
LINDGLAFTVDETASVFSHKSAFKSRFNSFTNHIRNPLVYFCFFIETEEEKPESITIFLQLKPACP